MSKTDYEEMMNEKPLIKVDESIKLKHGQLFGFKGLKSEDRITAAYPCWSHNGNEVQFVLYVSKDGRPCIDNDWVREDSNCMFTNVDPIIVEIPLLKRPTTFQDEIATFFGGSIPKPH